MKENRLKKGYDFFMSITPSKQNPMSWVYLHRWLEMLKDSAGKPIETEYDLQTVAQQIFGSGQQYLIWSLQDIRIYGTLNQL